MSQNGEDFNEDFNNYQLPTEDWLVQGFERNLASIKAGVPVEKLSTVKHVSEQTEIEDFSQASMYEQAIIELSELRDDLISSFYEYKSEKKLFSILENIIGRVEKTICSLGGEVEKFNPLDSMSGLENGKEEDLLEEDLLLKNAKSVVSNTQKHYVINRLSSISTKIIREKPAIVFQIENKDSNDKFRVVGAVVAKENFLGNEAIDYVRYEGRGHLSVKAFKDGKWQDVSSNFHLGIEDR